MLEVRHKLRNGEKLSKEDLEKSLAY